MKLLRRNNDKSNSVEMMHLKAIALIEELNERTKNGNEKIDTGRRSSERQKVLDPKRLLCFNNKVKKDQYEEYMVHGEENGKKSLWRSKNSKNIVEYSMDRKSKGMGERRNNGDISDLCNELCQDYYEIRKKLKNRPLVLTAKRAQILDTLAGSSSTSSSTDAPLRKFNNDEKRDEKHLHFSNENRELHRRQPSLLDDNGSVVSEKNKSKSCISNNKTFKSDRYTSNQYNSQKSKNNGSNTNRSKGDRYSIVKSNSNRSNTNGSNTKKSKSHRSNNLESNSNRYGRAWDEVPEISMSDSTSYTIPVSFVERKIHRSDLQPDISMISTLSSSSHSIGDESTVILSPRGANDKVDNRKSETKNSKVTLMCGPPACTSTSTSTSSRQQKSRLRVSRNPRSVIIAPSNLKTITECDDYSSSSASISSASSTSSYGSSAFSASSGIYESSGGSYDEEDDPSAIYARVKSRLKSVNKKKKNKNKNVNASCAIADGEIWNAFNFDDTNSIAESEYFRDEDRRDDYPTINCMTQGRP